MAHEIVHNTDLERFEIYVGEEVGAYSDYVDVGETRNFDHTVTKERFEGRGLASALIEHALDTTRAEGKTVVTSCTFVLGFIEEHPQYNDMVA